MPTMTTMNRYVGMAKAVPDSRRRLDISGTVVLLASKPNCT